MARKILYFLIFLVVAIVIVTRLAAQAREDAGRSAHPPEGQFLDVGGVAVHAVVRGSGPDLVLIHGAGGNVHDFTFSLVDKLAERYRVIAIDRPALGYTGRVRPEYAAKWGTEAETIAEQAALLQAAAAQLGADAPLVLGHSFGSAVALAWAVNHPGTYSGLVLIGGVSNPWPGDLSTLYRINASAIGGALAVPLQTAFAPQSAIDSSLKAIFAPNPVPEGYQDHIGINLSIARDATRANARMVWNLRPQVVEIHRRYAEIDAPTEIVHGEADTIVPLAVHSAKLVNQIEGAVLTTLPGIGHMPQHSAPDAVISAIDRAAERAGLR